MIILSTTTKSMDLSMKENLNPSLQEKNGIIWSGRMKKSFRQPTIVAFIWFLRYNIMDYQQGGNTFERKFKRRRKAKF